MSSITDAVFFVNSSGVVKQMMKTEFDALLDGIAQAPEFANQRVQAVYLQINESLKIKSLVCFYIGFDGEGAVQSDWNIPLNQLLQSAARGPDLGAGVTRLVSQSQCSVPWHQANLWNPDKSVFQALMQSVAKNKLGIVVSDDVWQGEAEIPTLNAEPKANQSAEIPTLEAAVPVLSPEAPANSEQLSQELAAMKQAYSIRIDKLQNEKEQLLQKNKDTVQSLKQQAKEHVEHLLEDFKQETEQKEQQLQSLRVQLEHEQKRYHDLKEQQVEQAALFQGEREDLLDKLEAGQDLESNKIDALKSAFSKELQARLEAQTTQLNEQLAMREVELFYREEQLALAQDQAKRLQQEKQSLLKDSGNKILKTMEDNGITFVAFHAGVGHITLAIEDIGRYLDQRQAYLAERCNMDEQSFALWQQHFNKPVCQGVDNEGIPCAKPVPRVEWAASFVPGNSDRCNEHKEG